MTCGMIKRKKGLSKIYGFKQFNYLFSNWCYDDDDNYYHDLGSMLLCNTNDDELINSKLMKKK
jgi:hypothetical protein